MGVSPTLPSFISWWAMATPVLDHNCSLNLFLYSVHFSVYVINHGFIFERYKYTIYNSVCVWSLGINLRKDVPPFKEDVDEWALRGLGGACVWVPWGRPADQQSLWGKARAENSQDTPRRKPSGDLGNAGCTQLWRWGRRCWSGSDWPTELAARSGTGLSWREGCCVWTVLRGPGIHVGKMEFHTVNKRPDTETTSIGGKAIKLWQVNFKENSSDLEVGKIS